MPCQLHSRQGRTGKVSWPPASDRAIWAASQMWDTNQTPFHLATLPVASSLVGWALLMLAIIWGLRPHARELDSGLRRWAWWGLLAAVLVAFRWPMIWLPHELYPDESQLLSGALTLRYDPVFWRSVDGGTAGPLDYYALVPAAFFPGVTSYAVTRLTAVLAIWGLLVAAGEALAVVAGRPAARLAVLPALMFEAFTTSAEFVHYSTELVPVLLLALAVLACVRNSAQAAVRHLWAAALLLGAVPFAKLQAAPIAATLGLFLVAHEIFSGRGRNVWLLISASLLPTLLFTALVTVTGQTEHMLIPYFLQNGHYTQIGRLPLSEVVRQLGEQSVTNGYHALWLAGWAVFCAGTLFFARNVPGKLRRHGLAAAGLLAVTILCILSPGRPYHHYLNLLTLPVTLLLGVALSLMLQSRWGGTPRRTSLLLGWFFLCTLLPQLALRVSSRPDPYDYYNTTVSARGPAHLELVAAIKSLSSPGESLGLWGWRSSLYVESGLFQATRQANTIFQLLPGPWQKYYLRCYFDDLVAAAPPVFVDAAGPGNFWFDNRAIGHEIYPLLRDWLHIRYRYIGEWDGVRVYARLDPAPAARRSD